ncbi:Uncharacterised protein [Staphylococcus saprophyticus]|nr:Uncharacterised protein [Staphylococcus saprophyticus]
MHIMLLLLFGKLSYLQTMEDSRKYKVPHKKREIKNV